MRRRYKVSWDISFLHRSATDQAKKFPVLWIYNRQPGFRTWGTLVVTKNV